MRPPSTPYAFAQSIWGPALKLLGANQSEHMKAGSHPVQSILHAHYHGAHAMARCRVHQLHGQARDIDGEHIARAGASIQPRAPVLGPKDQGCNERTLHATCSRAGNNRAPTLLISWSKHIHRAAHSCHSQRFPLPAARTACTPSTTIDRLRPGPESGSNGKKCGDSV